MGAAELVSKGAAAHCLVIQLSAWRATAYASFILKGPLHRVSACILCNSISCQMACMVRACLQMQIADASLNCKAGRSRKRRWREQKYQAFHLRWLRVSWWRLTEGSCFPACAGAAFQPVLEPLLPPLPACL